MTRRYYARSASDKTDDWPFWFVADSQRGGLNVTAEMIRQHGGANSKGGIFLQSCTAVKLAMQANKKDRTP